ncbi:unnamed protein product [Lepeophtheirus salmonis]|uniref:(salmon louse) hypothetical protein n=1 Tax=Lepeophtheirus salmonis TaxID=72036 RepID=A0A7R8H2Q8_LEPSM|nr:unnamed protein product [Lepeophtheirus salmonis]CAF2832300.1 unnamed protein product [Lepeophtheirus salmonis]
MEGCMNDVCGERLNERYRLVNGLLVSISTEKEYMKNFPGNSKANGAVEAALKQAKRLLRKASHSKQDPYLGLLNLRNTPLDQGKPVTGVAQRKPRTYEVRTLDGKNLRHNRQQLPLKSYGMDKIPINNDLHAKSPRKTLSVQSHNVGVPSETDAKNQGPISKESYVPVRNADAAICYFQLEFEEKSRPLTCFITT